MTEFYPAGNALQRAIAVLRNEGLRRFWVKVLGDVGYRRLLLQERPLSRPVVDVTPDVPVQIDVLGEGSVDEYFAFRPDSTRSLVAERLTSGHLCFVARHEGRVVSACWTATRRAWTDFLRAEIELAVGDAYLFDAFTLPAYRGKGVAPALYAHQLRELQQLGYRRAIRATVPENEPALRANLKRGFRPVRVIGRLKIGPWQRVFTRPWNGEAADGDERT